MDGVRKSTRRRKNPFVKSQYVSVSKIEKLDDPSGEDDGEDDVEEWSLEVDDEDYLDEEGEEGLVDIIDDQSAASTSAVPTRPTGTALPGNKTPTPAIRIIQGKKNIRLSMSTVNTIRRKLSVNGKRGVGSSVANC